MPVGAFVPSEFEYDYPRWAAPAVGSTDTGKAWAWNHATGKYEPATFLLRSAVSTYGLTLIDDADAATARQTLGLGTAAVLNVGTGANNVVQLDGSAKLPAVDGSQLTGVTVAVAGSNTQVIYNAAGVYAGHSGMTYSSANSRLTVTGGLVAPSMRPASDSTTALQLQNAAGSPIVTVGTTTSSLKLSNPSVAAQFITFDFGSNNANMFFGSGTSPARTALLQLDNSGNIVFRQQQGSMYWDYYSTLNFRNSAFINVLQSDFYGNTQVQSQSTLANSIGPVLVVRHNTTNTAGVGFGLGISAQLESTTTADQDAGRLTWEWDRDNASSAAHGTRSARVRLTGNYTSTERVFIDAIAGSSSPRIGFLGATPVARQVVPTGSSADTIITALQNLGLFSQT